MFSTNLRPGHLFGAVSLVAVGAAIAFWAPWSASARGSAATKTSNVAMNCAPNQQALVRQSVVNGELSVSIECHSGTAGTAAVYGTDLDQPTLDSVRPMNVVYRAAPVLVQTDRAPRASRVTRPVATRRAARAHDWRKDVLIVGGSAGAGAGIGGLVGGKKGALIGAALGGGGAALFRAAQK
jgi:hypothetical protein